MDPVLDPAGVLTHIRETRLDGDAARYYAIVAAGLTNIKSPHTPEMQAKVVAFWEEVAEMCDNGTADWPH